jgi:hypothetical protein
MAGLNRNIITTKDIENLRAATTQAELPKTFNVTPPGGVVLGGGGVVGLLPVIGGDQPSGEPGLGAAAGMGLAEPPTGDDCVTKLLKYVPPEVVSAYIFLSGIITGHVIGNRALDWWLGGLLVVMLAATVAYDIRVLNIVRPAQIVMSVIGLLVYAFALGGWFATMSWYQAWYGSLALVAFALIVAVVRLKPLPTSSADNP